MPSSSPNFTNPPPPLKYSLITFPTPHTLLITLNRPSSLNSISTAGHQELHALYTWYDAEPILRCAILTGTGRAFCAGADLKEWNASNQSTSTSTSVARTIAPSGFGGLSRRSGKKPVICAVNGICFGGGCEMIINADMVVAERQARFGLPEVKIGVVATAGALPRLVRTIGKQRAMEMVLTGREVGAEEAKEWGLVNSVVENGKAVEEALRLAEMVAGNSPDSVIVSREGVKLGWEGLGAEDATQVLIDGVFRRMDKGENMKEGVRSFVEKRKPRWVDSKL